MQEKDGSKMGTDREKKLHDLVKLYDLTLKRLIFEGNLLWQRFNAFLISHSIILGLIGLFIYRASEDNSDIIIYVIVTVLSIMGLMMCFSWRGAYSRSSEYYISIIYHIKKLEKKVCSLMKDLHGIEWCLYGGFFEKLSNDQCVCIQSKENCDSTGISYRIDWWGRTFSPSKWLPRVIEIYMIIYVLLIIFGGMGIIVEEFSIIE